MLILKLVSMKDVLENDDVSENDEVNTVAVEIEELK